MSTLQFIGFIATILCIPTLAIISGRKIKKGSQKCSGPVVAGLIMGTLVGGSSTVGTAQLAYNYGMSAWWFTLGGGIGCLVLTLVYATKLRAENTPTLIGIIRNEYGGRAGFCASILSSVGTYINIISQMLAASAVILVIWPEMATIWTVLISAVFMVLYVVFGGTKGAGIIGILKMLLLYGAMVLCGLLALSFIGGIGNVFDLMSLFKEQTGVSFGSVLARGAGEDLGSGLSLVLGVITTQTYGQAIINAKSDKDAKVGGLLSAFLIPPIGIFGIIVGLYMRSITDPTVFVAKTALTTFVMDYLPPAIGGVVLGTIFIASVGTGAGLALGISTTLGNDVIGRFTNKFDTEAKKSILSKVLIVAVLLLACSMSTGKLGDTILSFAFMSMGMRGAVIFLPMIFAIWGKGKVGSKYAVAAIIAGPVVVLLFGTVLSGVLPFDSLFAGVIADFIIMIFGYFRTQQKRQRI